MKSDICGSLKRLTIAVEAVVDEEETLTEGLISPPPELLELA